MSKPKDSSVYIKDILDSIKEIERYLAAHNYEDFLEDSWDQAAVIRNLEIIGEASNKISKSTQEQYPTVPWGEIIGLRNVLIHDYADVDVQIVWKIITEEIAVLKQALSQI